MRRKAIWVCLCVGAVGCVGGGHDGDFAELVTEQGESLITLEIERLRSEAELMRGLQGRSSLEDGHGVLLEFMEPSQLCVHNEGVGFPIDALFFDERNILVAVERGIPADDPTFRCHAETQRVLEVGGEASQDSWVGAQLILR